MHPIAVEDGFKIAVLIPSRNEARTIGTIVAGFSAALPSAAIFVFDDNSTDDTARAAALAGARVLRETRPGRDGCMRRMFADIDADIYLMASGDGDCDPADAPSLVNALITERVDMVVGKRAGPARRGILEQTLRHLTGDSTDIFSGYRAFTRRFVKSFPALPTGFGIETEMSVHASELMIPVAEIELNPTRPSATHAIGKLQTLARLALVAAEMRPAFLCSASAVTFWAAGLVWATPIVRTIAEGGLRPDVAGTAIASALFVIGFVIAACGSVLESLRRSRVEQKRILFLSASALGAQ